jgi:hypothetical protein
MATSKKKRTVQENVLVRAPVCRKLQQFWHGKPGDPVSSARFYWTRGDEPRESIEDYFLKKRRPAGAESLVDTAARVEPILRSDVPQDYANPDFLAASYMAKLPSEETAAFAQVTLSFPSATNLHHPWQLAQSWLREHYVHRVGVPVLAVLHAPFMVGSESAVHLHALVLMRKLTAFGWLTMHRELAGDAGLKAAERSWHDWLRQ